MAHYEHVSVPPDFTAPSKRDRQGGSFRRYHPDYMIPAGRVLDTETLEHAYDVANAVAVLGERLRARPLPMLYATLIRSESIASSWVEGERETPRNIMVAQLDHERSTQQGKAVARNINAMRTAIDSLQGTWTHQHIHEIHQILLPRQRPGYRRDQVYISGQSPLTAKYVAPPADEVQPYMDDLLNYANTSGDSPLIAALLIHAQFETIHPFSDGNGRVGRALFHGALHRGGVVTGGVLPLSVALKEDPDGYIAALEAYRHEGNEIDDRRAATSAYVKSLLGFVSTASEITRDFANQVERITGRWARDLSKYRSDSSIHRATDVLIQQPVVTASYLQECLGVTKMAAHTTIKNLIDAEVLEPAKGKLKRSNLFQATEILDVLASW